MAMAKSLPLGTSPGEERWGHALSMGGSPGAGGSGSWRRLKRPSAAVITARGSVEASSKDVLSGIGKVNPTGATVYCWYAPYYSNAC